jgi:hypothetical protein
MRPSDGCSTDEGKNLEGCSVWAILHIRHRVCGKEVERVYMILTRPVYQVSRITVTICSL